MSPPAGEAGVAIPTPPQSALSTAAWRRRQRSLRLNAAFVPGQAAGWSKFIRSARPLQGARLLQRPPRSGCIVAHSEAIEVRLADDVVDENGVSGNSPSAVWHCDAIVRKCHFSPPDPFTGFQSCIAEPLHPDVFC